ncbi:MAG TPA: formimidoylglutamate deiminase [Roseiarcus sp.]|nr:formimidoylglutamate deiminase [Roseiarcus sp.]
MPILHAARALTPDGWQSDVRVKIDEGAVAAVEIGVAAEAGDERHAIMAPAAMNLHSHAFQRAFAGLAEARGRETDTFWTWRETMYRFALMMSPDDVEAVAAQVYVEMLEAGFAAVAEFHYLHNAPDGSPYDEPAEMAARILAAAGRAGIGIVLLPVFYAHSTFGGAKPLPEQRRFVTDLHSFARLVEACRGMIKRDAGEAIGIAPHSLRAVTPEELAELIPLAGEGPIHIHAAEQIKEVEDCVAALGARPVRWLLDHAGVDERWCLVHATHMDESETRDLARSGAVAGLCPVTEANLGDGIFNAADYIREGGRYGVGTDSNVSIGVAAELRQLEYAQRLKERARNVCGPPGASCGRAMLEAVWSGGARALRRNTGKLAPGARANILTFRAGHPTLAGKTGDQILDAWIFSAGNSLIDCVWSGGLKVVTGGRHVFRDEIARQFVKTMAGLGQWSPP